MADLLQPLVVASWQVEQRTLALYDGLELTPAIVAGGSVANSEGNPGVAADAQGTPTDHCAFRELFPKGQYQNKYWYWKLQPDSTRVAFTYEGRLMLPEPQKPQALELDIQQVIGKQCFNWGLQWDFQGGHMRVWDRHSKGVKDKDPWISIGLPCPRWTASEWHSFKLDMHRDPDVTYDTLALDGVTTTLSKSFPSVPINPGDMINCALQLDGNSHGDAYRCYIDAFRFTGR